MCDWYLLPRIQLQWTFSWLWYLICRCLKLQKSVFLQLLITKVGIMMGPALDRTGLFSSYILRCSCVSLRRLSTDFARINALRVEKRIAWVVAWQVKTRQELPDKSESAYNAVGLKCLASIWWWEANISKAVYCHFSIKKVIRSCRNKLFGSFKHLHIKAKKKFDSYNC